MRNPLASREWLFRIAKNACLDRDKRTRGRTRLLRHWAATPRPDDGPGPSAPDDERIARVKAAVRGLPKKLRTVFVLRWYGGLSYEEIAVTLGLARGTVMSRLSRARARVAGMVEEK
jgi:RNA polymerase sigma-70 factor (ECF subfamily)